MKTKGELREYHRKYNAAYLKAKKAGVKMVTIPIDGRRPYGSTPICECGNVATVPYGKKFICERCHKLEKSQSQNKNYCGVYFVEKEERHDKYGEPVSIYE